MKFYSKRESGINTLHTPAHLFENGFTMRFVEIERCRRAAVACAGQKEQNNQKHTQKGLLFIVCMIADYRKNGKDFNKPFIAFDTSNPKKAVGVVAHKLRRQGFRLTAITVYPSARSILDLERLASGEIMPTAKPLLFIYDRAEILREAAKK